MEHYFQAQKFAGTEYEERVRRARTPADAKSLGRNRSFPLREDWDEEIVENAPGDYYWGSGADGTGKNKLGKLLMDIRAMLRAPVQNSR